MYDDQMEMFQDGGLKDQGNTIDPVSGNDVPSGSLKEEVRDDIDAKLSPGEFVFPADVVRFVGLEKLMMMRDKAKKGLSRMEDMGQMGNSEEATIDDDVPFGMEDLIIVAGSPDNEMSKGGVINARDGVFVNDGRRGRGAQLFGDIGDGYMPPTTYYNPDTGQEMTSTKINGKFFPPLPRGFIEKPQKVETKPRDVKSTTAKVESTLGSGEVDGGPDRGDVSVGEMTETEQAAFGKDLAGPMGGVIGGVAKGIGMLGDFALGPPTLGKAGAFAVGALTDTQIDTSLGIAKGIDKDLATAKASYAKQQSYSKSALAAQRDRDTQTAVDRAQQSYENSVGAPAGSTGTAGVGTIGGIPSQMAVDIHGTVTDLSTGDIIGGKDAKDFKDRMDRKAGVGNELDAPGPDNAGAVGGKGGGQSDDTGPDTDTGQSEGQGTEEYDGGLIVRPKRKKQKKMKRGGLASR